MKKNMICIPRVSLHIKKREIYEVFEKVNLGVIDSIELRHNTTNDTNLCIIDIRKYNNNTRTRKIKNDLEEGGHFTIVYRERAVPILWKCYKYTNNYIKPNM